MQEKKLLRENRRLTQNKGILVQEDDQLRQYYERLMQYQEQLEQYGDDSIFPGELLYCVFIFWLLPSIYRNTQ